MSMMLCNGCDHIRDTDEDLDGLWEETKPSEGGKNRWWCTQCVEDLHDRDMLLTLKKQEPERYKELTE